MPNPIFQAKICNFTLQMPINIENRRFIGKCICGTLGSVSYDSLVKRKFCRNSLCKYFQPAKILDIY